MSTPKLRFPEFENDGEWSDTELGNLALFVNEKITINQLTINNYVSTENILPDYAGLVPASKLPSVENATRFKVSDILISNIRPYLKKVSLAEIDGGSSNDVIVVRASSEVNPIYLSYILRNDSFIEYVMNGAKGVKMPRGDISMIKDYPVPYPKPEEQQKIADCLSSLDDLITAQNQKVEALKQHKKGLMQQLFPDSPPAKGEYAEGGRGLVPKLRFPEFENTKKWDIVPLSSVSDVRDGTHDSPKFFEVGKPLLTSKNLLKDGSLDTVNVSFISDSDFEQINKRSKVDVGDILFGMIGTIGNPVMVKTDGFAIKNIALIKQKTDLLNSYLLQLLNSDYIAKEFSVLNTGNSQKFIALGQIRSLKIPAPSLLEQQKIANCLSSIDELITTETQQLEAYKTHKKGLMQQLFPSVEEVDA